MNLDLQKYSIDLPCSDYMHCHKYHLHDSHPRCMKRVERVKRTAAVIGAAVQRSHAGCLACLACSCARPSVHMHIHATSTAEHVVVCSTLAAPDVRRARARRTTSTSARRPRAQAACRTAAPSSGSAATATDAAARWTYFPSGRPDGQNADLPGKLMTVISYSPDMSLLPTRTRARRS